MIVRLDIADLRGQAGRHGSEQSCEGETWRLAALLLSIAREADVIDGFSAREINFFQQAKFPRLWLLFQHVFGVIDDKRRLVLKKYRGQKRVLEIGCSAGIVSRAFAVFDGIEFVGIDVDDGALSLAQKQFRHLENFRFENLSLAEIAKAGKEIRLRRFCQHIASRRRCHGARPSFAGPRFAVGWLNCRRFGARKEAR